MFRIQRMTTLFSTAAAVLMMSTAAPAEDGAPTSYYYSYFKEQIPLGLAHGRVAVFRSDGAAAASKIHSQSLSQLGISPEDVTEFTLSGWSIALTPSEIRTDSEVEEMVGTLAESADLDFVSPVFLDRNGDPLLITADLLVRFEDFVPAEEAEELLAAHVGYVPNDRDWEGMPGLYLVATGLHNGFEVLSLANELAQLPEVKYAESDMIMTARKSLIPDDTYFYLLWGLHNTGQTGGATDMDMDAPEAWDITIGRDDTYVVIFDDGIEQDHPDINQRNGSDFTGQGTAGDPANECDNHGTAVAGCT